MGANPITQTALVKCSFGTAPASVTVNAQSSVNVCGVKAATVLDNKALFFGTCSSPAHPVVASTGAPGPCLAAAQVTAPWTPGSAMVRVCGLPAAHKNCRLICGFGGVIQMTVSPAATVRIGG